MCFKCYCWSETGGSGYLRDKVCKGEPSSSYNDMHSKVVERRQHPSQVKTQQVHAIIAVDQDPWVWRKLRNVREVAQDGPDGQKRVRYLTQDPQHEAKVHATLGVQNTWGSRTCPANADNSMCNTLPTLPMKRGPDEGNSASSKDGKPRLGARRHGPASSSKRQSDELELEVMPPESQDLPFTVRQAKSARNY